MIFALLFAWQAAVPTIFAADFYVDAVNGNDGSGDGSAGNPYKSITAGVAAANAAASPPHRVLVQPGTYSMANTGEVFAIQPDNGVSIIGLQGSSNTIISNDSVSESFPIKFYKSTTLETRLEGVTISTGGVYVASSNLENNVSPTISNNSISPQGNGIVVYGGYGTASPTIASNTISGGFGVYIDAYYGTATPTFSNNTIDSSQQFGVKIQTDYLGVNSPVLDHNIITNASRNGIRFVDQSNGTGISNPTIISNTITNNGSGYPYVGSGIYGLSFNKFAGTIDSNIISNNTVSGINISGSYYSGDYLSPMITNNTIENNGRYGVDVQVGAGGGSPVISSNTLANNSAWQIKFKTYGPGLGPFIAASSPTINNNNVTGTQTEPAIYFDAEDNAEVSASISNNSITNTNAPGMRFYTNKARLAANVSNNTVTGNSGKGIYFDFYYQSVSTPTISYNTINSQSEVALSLSADDSEVHPAIDHNAITSASDKGLFLRGGQNATFGSTISNDTISNNTISGAGVYGGGFIAWMYSGSTMLTPVSNNSITGNSPGVNLYTTNGSIITSPWSNNTITGSDAGVFLYYGTSSDSPNPDFGGGASGSIGHNTIIGNSGSDLDNSGNVNVNATNNWWRDTPPTQISGSVTFNPANNQALSFTINPNSGGPGTAVQITAGAGTAFVDDVGPTPARVSVKFGGIAATVNSVNAAGTVINATVPNGVAGTVDVMVTNPAGQTGTLAGGFGTAAQQTVPPGGGTITSGSTIVTIPPGAFDSPVTVSVGGASVFPGGSLGLNGIAVGIEITVAGGLQPLKPVTLKVCYTDADVAGVDEETLVLARRDAVKNVWVPLFTIPDPPNNCVTATTDHFSLFQIMAAGPQSTVDNAKIFPNPFRPTQGHTLVTFAVLPANARVRIYTFSGGLVKDITASSAGIATWDATNQSGQPVASGVYFVFVQGAGQSKTFKVAVQR